MNQGRGAFPGTNPRRSRGRNVRNGRNNVSVPSMRMVRQLVSGSSYIPTEMPPVITAQPWNNVDLLFKMSTTTPGVIENLSLSKLLDHLKNQCGFSSVLGANFDVRIQSVACWMTEVGHCSLYPFDFITGSVAELSRLDSFAQKNMYARVGFHYPAHLQSATMSTASTKSVNIFGLASTVSSAFDICLKILWKGADTKTAIEVVEYVYPHSSRKKRLNDLVHEFSNLELALKEACEAESSESGSFQDLAT